ncbi:MAG: hypothetical protein ACI37Q_01335 [Candidatus Gastranaerophilaceae bacterium]
MPIYNKISPQRIYSAGFRLVNRVRRTCGRQQLTDFRLTTKSENLPVSESMNKAIGIFLPNVTADTFSYVSIGKHSDLSYRHEIMTFYDKCKRVILRTFKKDDNLYKMRCYRYGLDNDAIIATYKSIPEKANSSSDDLQMVSVEYRRVTSIKSNTFSENNPSPQRVSIKKVEMSDFNGKANEEITFLYTPFNRGVGKPSDRKFLKGTVVFENDNVSLNNIEKSDNVKLDFDDKYLTVRFLDPRTEAGIKVLTGQLLKEKSLDKLKLKIVANCELDEGVEGSFSSDLRTIFLKNFTEYCFHEDAVNCSAHEVEHAYQYSLIGRLGKGNTSYETDAMNINGELTDINEINEAVRYSIADTNYPSTGRTNDNPLYKYNYLEVKARQFGEKIADEYENSLNYDFFEEFKPIEI